MSSDASFAWQRELTGRFVLSGLQPKLKAVGRAAILGDEMEAAVGTSEIFIDHLEHQDVAPLTQRNGPDFVFIEGNAAAMRMTVDLFTVEVELGLVIAARLQHEVGAVGVRVHIANSVGQLIFGGGAVEDRE